MRVVRRALWVLLVGALLVGGWRFAAQNQTPVAVHVLATRLPEAPLWASLVCAFAGGALAAGLLCLYQILKLRLLARRYRRTVVRLESEIHQLRNLPLDPGAAEVPLAETAVAARASGGDG